MKCFLTIVCGVCVFSTLISSLFLCSQSLSLHSTSPSSTLFPDFHLSFLFLLLASLIVKCTGHRSQSLKSAFVRSHYIQHRDFMQPTVSCLTCLLCIIYNSHLTISCPLAGCSVQSCPSGQVVDSSLCRCVREFCLIHRPFLLPVKKIINLIKKSFPGLI